MTTTYSIGEASRETGLPVSTIRYYHQNGLMPQVKRTDGGTRRFTQSDIDWIRYLERLKATGMPINEMRTFVSLIDGGDETVPQRQAIMENRRQEVEHELEELTTTLSIIKYKLWYYQQARELGEEKARAIEPDQMPPEIRAARELCAISW